MRSSVAGSVAWVLLAVMTACAPDSPPLAQSSVRVFRGAWFEVSYPAGFRPRPSLRDEDTGGVESAFFDSPDGKVSLYVHAPQWGGEPADVALQPAAEELVDRVVTNDGPIRVTRTTTAARSGEWTRTIVTTYDDRGPSQWTVGWQYRSEEARNTYAAAFAAFRQSLQQFAD